jgi:hypothetical protein
MIRRTLLPAAVAASLVAVLVGCSSGDADGSTTGAEAATTTTTSEAATTSELPQDDGSRIKRRLADELDPETAATVVAELDQGRIDAIVDMADGDVEGSPWLSYDPATMPDDEVDALWVFSYGHRIDPAAGVDGVDVGDDVPPMDQLLPGPTNEALAQAAADFVAEHPVPIVAQWEVAQVLEDLGVEDVISVEPDVAADGTVTYLSTQGVAEKGLALAADAKVDPGRAGVLCFADHAVRCLRTAEAAGLDAAVPEGVELPATYDAESGQTWTRSRQAWVPVDLLGRAALAANS